MCFAKARTPHTGISFPVAISLRGFPPVRVLRHEPPECVPGVLVGRQGVRRPPFRIPRARVVPAIQQPPYTLRVSCLSCLVQGSVLPRWLLLLLLLLALLLLYLPVIVLHTVLGGCSLRCRRCARPVAFGAVRCEVGSGQGLRRRRSGSSLLILPHATCTDRGCTWDTVHGATAAAARSNKDLLTHQGATHRSAAPRKIVTPYHVAKKPHKTMISSINRSASLDDS